ncbi:hypothetical protein Q4E93_29535 [Flavitalea sp. BT771]|uniref:hypothetical protein n=1 Tax=Flavitalea sp. BT771 TaxID=3063329 RepID=UPI0026E43B8B|nr:hypothetical protein [Flavitalea sp. BT771]MDO6434791.1 hypothetical protein [Flavitalea sp. BT771]MDV6223691.1 hypothetical protein [Flavitalea sp. BT771]
MNQFLLYFHVSLRPDGKDPDSFCGEIASFLEQYAIDRGSSKMYQVEKQNSPELLLMIELYVREEDSEACRKILQKISRGGVVFHDQRSISDIELVIALRRSNNAFHLSNIIMRQSLNATLDEDTILISSFLLCMALIKTILQRKILSIGQLLEIYSSEVIILGWARNFIENKYIQNQGILEEYAAIVFDTQHDKGRTAWLAQWTAFLYTINPDELYPNAEYPPREWHNQILYLIFRHMGLTVRSGSILLYYIECTIRLKIKYLYDAS